MIFIHECLINSYGMLSPCPSLPQGISISVINGNSFIMILHPLFLAEAGVHLLIAVFNESLEYKKIENFTYLLLLS